MSETDPFIGQKQDTLIWEGLQTLQELHGWMMAARNPDLICAAVSELTDARCKTARGLAELHRSDVESDTVYSRENLEHFLPVYRILKLQ
jgi:hypothetical protein